MPDLADPVKALDAYPTAAPGEPTFTLQGGDPFAPACVLEWAKRARAFALTLPEDDPRQDELLLRATSAEQVAWEMQAYQRGEASDSDAHAAMTQAKLSTSMIGAASDDARAKLQRHRLLNEAARSLDNAASILVDLGDFPTIANAVAELSDEVRPSR